MITKETTDLISRLWISCSVAKLDSQQRPKAGAASLDKYRYSVEKTAAITSYSMYTWHRDKNNTASVFDWPTAIMNSEAKVPISLEIKPFYANMTFTSAYSNDFVWPVNRDIAPE